MDNKSPQYHVLARGVIISEEYLLVAKCNGMDNTFLPGGHVEFNEGMRATLKREINEELGLDCVVENYIGAVEAAFNLSDTYHQEMNHLFKVVLANVTHEIRVQSKESHLEFYWIHIDELEQYNLQPYPVRGVVKCCLNREQGPFWESTFE